MPRVYRRKTEERLTPHYVMRRAVEAVQNGMSTREAATNFGVSKSSLNRYVQKIKVSPNATLQPNYQHKKVFSQEQERSLADYLRTCSNMFYGLSMHKTRILAYEMALHNKVKVPPSWKDTKEAGKEWLYHFLRRHPDLSLRTPEATSLARASAFNRENVARFFKILTEAVVSTKATAFTIYNLDESGCTTVQSPPKVLAPKGQKQVGQITSQERGELVTVCCIVSASGSSVPPVFIFPRKNFKAFMMNGGPEGSLGLASSNGWMNCDLFPKVIEHFISFARPDKDKQVILIMDNHQSHLSMTSLELAKENFVHIITLPPHTSNKTQPLDRTVFGPMKTYFNSAANSFMLQNPGKNITIYDMASLINNAWTKAATPENIMSGFRVSGIWPLNELIFEDHDFLPSSVTDRPLQNQETTAVATAIPAASPAVPSAAPTVLATASVRNSYCEASTSASTTCEASTSASTTCEASTSASTTCEASTSASITCEASTSASITCEASTSASPTCEASTSAEALTIPATPTSTAAKTPNVAESRIVSPIIFRGYPKMSQEKTLKKRRKRGKSMLATASPEIQRMKMDAAAKRDKKKQPKAKKNLVLLLDSDSDDLSLDELQEQIDDTENSHSDMEDDDTIALAPVDCQVNVNDFVHCQFATKKTLSYYVAKVLEAADDEGDIQVIFLKRNGKTNKFVFSKEDPASFPIDDVRYILPNPTRQGTTKRTSDILTFDVNFGDLNVQ